MGVPSPPVVAKESFSVGSASAGIYTPRNFLRMIFRTYFRFTKLAAVKKTRPLKPLGDILAAWRVVTSEGTLLLLVNRNSGT